MIFHRFILGDMTTNCYIVADETSKAAVLFDAPDRADVILDYVKSNNLELKYVLLTHSHFDHILALYDILNETDAKLIIHKDEEKYLNNPHLNMASLKGINIPEFKDYQIACEGEKIFVGDMEIKVIHTPGHTEGSTCYLIENVLISGDTLFKQSIGRADFPLGNYDDEIASIKNKLMCLDDSVKVYPGHGFSTTIGRERKENPYLI